ncbi:MAG: diaminopimelate epimerase, partial [Bacteroidota bacterium]|nr:diaminopimelate epimerase [Bacteroidota bacterium]
DGLIILSSVLGMDFEIIFYNPDGSLGFCANGSLCALHFFKKKFISRDCSFKAFDGIHMAIIENDIHLKMKDINKYKKLDNGYYLNSGAPHHVKFVNGELLNLNIIKEYKDIRKHNFYKKKLCNINLVFIEEEKTISIRTFEKGVNRETLSCGTGAVASVVATSIKENLVINSIKTKGGKLKVIFNKNKKDKFSDIYLIGSPQEVFRGKINL